MTRVVLTFGSVEVSPKKEETPKSHERSTCRKCKRNLKNPKHRSAGIGPVCAAKEAELRAPVASILDELFR